MATYHAVITSNALAFSRQKNTPSIKLQLKTDTRLDDNAPVEKTFYADLWLSDNAKTRTVETLRAIGYAGNDLTELNNPCLMGYEVEVSTSYEDYNGKSYEKVDFVNEVGSYEKRGIKSIDDAQAKRLASSLNAIFRNSKNVGKAHIKADMQKQQDEAPAATSEGDDSLPF